MNVELFSDIPKVKNSLYVFDIDDTTLHYDIGSSKRISAAIEYFEENLTRHKWLFKQVNALWEKRIINSRPIAHDRPGLEELKKFCDENNSRIIFLTARFKTIKVSTMSHLQELYPWVRPSSVYFCDGVEKGIVLLEIISKMQYNTVIFVDDKEYNLNSVKKYVPGVILYKMAINLDSLPKE